MSIGGALVMHQCKSLFYQRFCNFNSNVATLGIGHTSIANQCRSLAIGLIYHRLPWDVHPMYSNAWAETYGVL